MSLNQLATRISKENIEKGFWTGTASDKSDAVKAQKVALIHSEVSELLESLREVTPQPDKHVKYLSNSEIECADTIIRLLDMAGRYQWDIDEAVRAKLEVNSKRTNKHGKRF